MLPKHIINYMAGFFDSEGCIYINKQARGKNAKFHPTYQGSASVTNTIKKPLILFLKYFGGRIYFVKEKGKRSDRYFWRIVSRDALNFCMIMQNYFLIKKQQAGVLIELQKTITKTGPKTLPNKILKRREDLYLKIRDLNKIGQER